MKALKYILVLVILLSLTVPAAFSQEVPLKPDIPDTGELFGDLYVILRDVNGVPIMADYTIIDGEGNEIEGSCVQPISAVDGEPFALATYIDDDGDVVECELTEEMLAWVQSVDFGRLNLGRAPDSVIDHAFDEAINKMNVATDIGIDPAGRLILTIPDEEDGWVAKTVDAPAENLALYIKMMTQGHWITLDTTAIIKDKRPEDVGPSDDDGPSTEDRPVLACWEEDGSPSALQGQLALLGYGGLCQENVLDPVTGLPVLDDEGNPVLKTGEDLSREELLLAASLLAAAADKTGNITLDKVVYINSIYGINQLGTLSTANEGETYFNFGLALGEAEPYVRATHYAGRSSGSCPLGEIWVLQPELVWNNEDPPRLVPVGDHYVTTCMDILGHEPGADPYQENAVHFVDQEEVYTTVFDEYGAPLEYDFSDNVRAFVQASDDALQVLEYLHNYKTPEDLYGVYPDQ